MNDFTLMEYIIAKQLGVGERDSAGQKMVAEHLRSLGFHKRRVRLTGQPARLVYSRNDREVEIKLLKDRLATLAEIARDEERKK